MFHLFTQGYNLQIYLDNIATTRVDPVVNEAMLPYIDMFFGNASSIHSLGTKATTGIENARNIIADKILAFPDEIFFTSGGTEANNWALKGVFSANRNKGNHIIISPVEHPSIIESAKWLEYNNAEISYVPVDNMGFVSIDDIHRLIKKETILVSIMHANNETGTIQPIEEIGKLCKEKNIYFHTDACQSFTKLDIDIKKYPFDLASINAHKIHGPKGIGALFIKKGTHIDPFFHGGGQENCMRAGTYNTQAIVGFGKSVEIAKQEDLVRMKKFRDYFLDKILNKIDNIIINGPEGDLRLCNNLNIGFSGVAGKHLLMELSKKGIFISIGSACSSTKLEPSYVLTAMGIDSEIAHSSIRIGLSKWTTREEIDITIDNICMIVNMERSNKNR